MMLRYRAGDYNLRVTEHFRVREFRCKDKTELVIIDSELADLLERIRCHFGKPLYITSAYRTPEHNKKVGGKPNSQHLQGKAADFYVKGVDPIEVYHFCDTLIGNKGGVGKYPTFTHIDTRGYKARW